MNRDLKLILVDNAKEIGDRTRNKIYFNAAARRPDSSTLDSNNCSQFDFAFPVYMHTRLRRVLNNALQLRLIQLLAPRVLRVQYLRRLLYNVHNIV